MPSVNRLTYMKKGSIPASMSSSILCFLLSICVFCSVGLSSNLQWVRLTNENFTSDIHSHPFLLCIATVPWCGESRSIMKALLKSIQVDERLYSVVQLRVVYVNVDKISDAFFSGKPRYPTLTFYRHSIPFQYRGKLKVQNILTAIHHALLFNSWDFSLKKLEKTSELNSFMESTDKAVILFDFCNYSERFHSSKQRGVLDKPVDTWSASKVDINLEETINKSVHSKERKGVKQYNADTKIYRSEDVQLGDLKVEKEKTQPSSGAVLQEDAEINFRHVNREDNEVHSTAVEASPVDNTEIGSSNLYGTSSAKNYLGNVNDIEHQLVSCQPETDFLLESAGPFPWIKSIKSDQQIKSLSANSIQGATFSLLAGCNRTGYKHFARVYQNLTKVIRSHTLTPERTNFAIIRNKSLLSDLGIDSMQNSTWFLMQWMLDQPHLPRLYLENERLDSFLSSSEQLVLELNQEVINHPSTFSDKKSSLILFIDRASSVLEVRLKSWEALRALRAFARNYGGGDVQVSTNMDDQMESKSSDEDKSDIIRSAVKTQLHAESLPSLKDLIGHETLQLLKDQKIRLMDELTGKDHSGHSVETKQGSNVVLKILLESGDKLQLQGSLSSFISDKVEALDLSETLSSEDSAIYEVQEGKIAGKVDTDDIVSSLERLQPLFTMNSGSFGGQESPYPIKENIETSLLDVGDKEVVKRESTDLNVETAFSFYFADGEDQWKDMVLPGLPYPSLVILDSSKGGRFVFPSHNQSINYQSLKAFVDQFTKHNLQKTYVSEFPPQEPRKQVQPPFVNRDFHEVHGVPRVTTESLLQVLFQSQMVEAPPKFPFDCTKKMDSTWKRDVLVLFTNPSCGFCKRMELVFREVHQLLTLHLGEHDKGRFLERMAKQSYATIDMMEDREGDWIEGTCTSNQGLKVKENIPCLLQIDCTSNDCSVFFTSINQEIYPSIILYPAGKKELPVVFEGGPTVQDILCFIAVEGKSGPKVLHFLQGGSQNKMLNSMFKRQMGCDLSATSSKSIHIDSNIGSNKHAYHFTTNTRKTASSFDDEKDQNAIKPIIYPTIGSMLLATDQLSKASKVFESSSVLIVKADGQEGFQGLILNKPLAWNRLPGLNMEMESLINRTLLCYGGPVIVQGQPFVSLSRLNGLEGFSEVVPGVYFGSLSATMRVLQSIEKGELQAQDFWFFLGHAVWGWQQLLNEIAEHFWNLTSYEQGKVHLPVKEWLDGSSISVSDLLKARENAEQ